MEHIPCFIVRILYCMVTLFPGDVTSAVEHLSNAVAVCNQPHQLLQVNIIIPLDHFFIHDIYAPKCSHVLKEASFLCQFNYSVYLCM